MAEEKKLLNVSSNPHVRDKITTRTIMLLVLLALLPATGYGVYHFGLYSLAVVLVTTGTAVIWEFIWTKFFFFPKSYYKNFSVGFFSVGV